jgi:hypothetical protein
MKQLKPQQPPALMLGSFLCSFLFDKAGRLVPRLTKAAGSGASFWPALTNSDGYASAIIAIELLSGRYRTAARTASAKMTTISSPQNRKCRHSTGGGHIGGSDD